MKALFVPLLLSSLFLPLLVGGVTIAIENPLQADSFTELIYNIVNFLFRLSLPVGALMIVIAAYGFLTSAGDPEKVSRAKRIIIWTLVGIIVLFLSVAILAALQSMLGVEGGTPPNHVVP